MSCGYTGWHFGAYYEDAICIDGYLWDLDSCDEPGGPLCSGVDIACPCCNTRKYVAEFRQFAGNAKQRRKHRRVQMRRIRNWPNCKMAGIAK